MNEGPYASWRGVTDFIRLLGVQLCSFSFEYSPHLYLDPRCRQVHAVTQRSSEYLLRYVFAR